ncbi:MAG TPA: hypothetical protein PKC99_17265 [Anaerolineales bacterium]|nr:hypothetical protein [Anaerolineales bacterium]
MAKLIIYLGALENDALHQLALRELRAPRAQAALIIRNELSRLGLLTSSSPMINTEKQEDQIQEAQP